MPFLISDSPAPLLMETVPVLKLTQFRGTPARDCVYAYLRCFVCRGALHFCLTCFDGEPPETARFGFALQPAQETEKYLLFSTGPQAHAALEVRSADGAVLQTPDVPAVHRVTGGDEQGWFWSAEGVLPAALFLQVFGQAPQAGTVWAGNVFLYSTQEAAFGAAFAVPQGRTVPTAEGFDVFTVVPY